MAASTLESRIESWPNQWKTARTRFTEAKAALAKLHLQLEAAEKEEKEARESQEDTGDGDASPEDPMVVAAESRLLEAEHAIQLAAFAVEQAKAEAEVSLRQESLSAIRKPTESAIEAAVRTDDGYVTAQRRLINAKHEAALAKAEERRASREYQQRLREERRTAFLARPASGSPDVSENLTTLRLAVADAEVDLDRALAELEFQEHLGETLQMLTDLCVKVPTKPH